jgi:hypothetical protein
MIHVEQSKHIITDVDVDVDAAAAENNITCQVLQK